MNRICARPEVWLADDFVSPAQCAEIRALSRDRERALADGWEPTVNETGFAQEIPIEGSAPLEALRAAIEGAMHVENDTPWTFRYRRYGVGEGHPPHVDCYALDGLELIATALLYLSDTESGGETEFVHPDLKVAPRAGRLVIWYNHTPDGARDLKSVHAGRPVLRGEKEILVWLVYKPAEIAAIRPDTEMAPAELAPDA